MEEGRGGCGVVVLHGWVVRELACRASCLALRLVTCVINPVTVVASSRKTSPYCSSCNNPALRWSNFALLSHGTIAVSLMKSARYVENSLLVCLSFLNSRVAVPWVSGSPKAV